MANIGLFDNEVRRRNEGHSDGERRGEFVLWQVQILPIETVDRVFGTPLVGRQEAVAQSLYKQQLVN